MANLKGCSYQKRLKEIIKIYDLYAPQGVPNAYIWKEYIYPNYGISISTFYNYLKNSGRIIEE